MYLEATPPPPQGADDPPEDARPPKGLGHHAVFGLGVLGVHVVSSSVVAFHALWPVLETMGKEFSVAMSLALIVPLSGCITAAAWLATWTWQVRRPWAAAIVAVAGPPLVLTFFGIGDDMAVLTNIFGAVPLVFIWPAAAAGYVLGPPVRRGAWVLGGILFLTAVALGVVGLWWAWGWMSVDFS